MLQVEHSAIPLTFIKLPFVIRIFVLSIFERPFYTGFTVPSKAQADTYACVRCVYIHMSEKIDGNVAINIGIKHGFS